MNVNWLYLVCELGIPLVMLLLGIHLRFHPPVFGESGGYNSEKAKKNEILWNAAQITCGKAMLILSIPAFIIGIAAGAIGIALDFGEDFGAVFMIVIDAVQAAILFVGIAFVEKRLSRMIKK